jgi:uncharacterized protein YndB with AHSA1/START domain
VDEAALVEVRSDRRYQFAAEPSELWSTMVQIGDYQSWWPWLHHFAAEDFEPGEVWACTVQPPLPYSLSFHITLDEVEPERFVTATIDGDIFGDARIDLTPTAEGTELRLVSNLGPSNTVLRAIAKVARPVVRFGHDWVIDSGLRQFRDRAL